MLQARELIGHPITSLAGKAVAIFAGAFETWFCKVWKAL
ncbi:hypothetical protein sync_0847 [Synechococcus sp. CC9311]|nr:hypothetical protein sync_0847 [Synechococcus sp. CC9311]